MAAKTITLKALVDKEKNKIIYAESKGDFVNVLFSFLTMPLGTIARLTRNHPPKTELGCINNLYASVENLDAGYFWSEGCRTMLLCPQNAAADHCKNLKVQIDTTDPVKYFLCDDSSCKYQLLSHYKSAPCHCGRGMNREAKYVPAVYHAGFAAETAQFIVTDELEVVPASSVFLFSLLAKHGVQDCSSLEERIFQIGADEVLNLLKFSRLSRSPLTDVLLLQKSTTREVLNLLKFSRVSRTPLTDVLLRKSSTREVNTEHMGQDGFIKRLATEGVLVQNGSKISLKLLISKSKGIVCYAEAREDFVNLLFSFLTIPLGHVFKEPLGASCTKGSLKNLYKSVHDLDPKTSLISEAQKDMLCNPKLAKWFGSSAHLLGFEEVGNKYRQYHYGLHPSSDNSLLATDQAVVLNICSTLSLVDHELPNAEATKNREGFTRKPTMFTVTNDLKVTLVSPTSSLSILMKLGVPYTDIEERTVLVGKEEALSLLVAAFNGSTCALTQVFLSKRQEESSKHSTSWRTAREKLFER